MEYASLIDFLMQTLETFAELVSTPENEFCNPHWSKVDVEQELKARLGLQKNIWLPGIKGKDITDSCVDFYACFVKPGVMTVNIETDPQFYDYKVTLVHLDILKHAASEQRIASVESTKEYVQ